MTSHRTMLGDRGPAVRDWQAFLARQGLLSASDIDGVHGPRTEAASALYEQQHGPATLPDGGAHDVPGADSRLVTHAVWDPSYRYGSRQRGEVLWVVLHSAETECTDSAALAVARYLEGNPKASAHYVVGPSIVVQQVRERHAAYTQGPANRLSIGVEHAGRSLPGKRGEPATDWLAHPDMLRTSARLCRERADAWGIPWRVVDAAGVAAREPGITWHGAITSAFAVKGGHCDPLRWPWSEWLSLGGV